MFVLIKGCPGRPGDAWVRADRVIAVGETYVTVAGGPGRTDDDHVMFGGGRAEAERIVRDVTNALVFRADAPAGPGPLAGTYKERELLRLIRDALPGRTVVVDLGTRDRMEQYLNGLQRHLLTLATAPHDQTTLDSGEPTHWAVRQGLGTELERTAPVCYPSNRVIIDEPLLAVDVDKVTCGLCRAEIARRKGQAAVPLGQQPMTDPGEAVVNVEGLSPGRSDEDAKRFGRTVAVTPQGVWADPAFKPTVYEEREAGLREAMDAGVRGSCGKPAADQYRSGPCRRPLHHDGDCKP